MKHSTLWFANKRQTTVAIKPCLCHRLTAHTNLICFLLTNQWYKMNSTTWYHCARRLIVRTVTCTVIYKHCNTRSSDSETCCFECFRGYKSFLRGHWYSCFGRLLWVLKQWWTQKHLLIHEISTLLTHVIDGKHQRIQDLVKGDPRNVAWDFADVAKWNWVSETGQYWLGSRA